MTLEKDLAALTSWIETGYTPSDLDDFLHRLEWAAADIGRGQMVRQYATSLRHHYAIATGKKRSDGNHYVDHQNMVVRDAMMIRRAFSEGDQK